MEKKAKYYKKSPNIKRLLTIIGGCDTICLVRKYYIQGDGIWPL